MKIWNSNEYFGDFWIERKRLKHSMLHSKDFEIESFSTVDLISEHEKQKIIGAEFPQPAQRGNVSAQEIRS